MASTSINLFLFPVMKFSCLGAIVTMDDENGGRWICVKVTEI
jgi:hypothetical protein